MQFIDPVQFLQMEGKSLLEIDDAILLRARKRLMAEFQFSGNGQVVIDGRLVSLAEALQLLDSLADKAVQAHFAGIERHQILKEFLRNPNPKRIEKVAKLPLWDDVAFLAFCSQFLKTSVGEAMAVALKQKNWRGLLLLVMHSTMLEPTDLETAYGPLIRYVGLLGIDLEAASDGDAGSLDIVLAGMHTDLRLMYLLNHLPAQYMSLRNKHALRLKELALSIHESKHPQVPRPLFKILRLLSAGCYLLIDPAIREKLENAWIRTGMHQKPFIFGSGMKYQKPLRPPFSMLGLAGKIGTAVLMAFLALMLVILCIVWVALRTHRH